MTVIQRSIDVAATPEASFDYVADFASCAEWDPGVAAASLRSGSSVGPGAIYDVEVVFGERRLPMVYEVTQWERPLRVVLHGTGSRIRAEDDISFEAIANGTRIHYRADLRLPGALALFTPLLRTRFEALGDAAMQGMADAFRRKAD